MRQKQTNSDNRGGTHWPISATVAVVLLVATAPASAEVQGNLRIPSAALGINDPSAFAANGNNAFDDGWRKTDNGWEHVSTWEHPPLLASNHLIVLQPRDFREVTKYDLHPLAWVALMVFVSLAALMFLPGSSPPENARPDIS